MTIDPVYPPAHQQPRAHNGIRPGAQAAALGFSARHQRIAALTLILLLGALLRIVNIGQQPLWADEGFSAFAITQPDLLLALMRDVHPPVYFAGLKAWAALAGLSELALRWFTLLPSMVSIALMPLLAREVLRLHPLGQTGQTLHPGSARAAAVVPVLAALLMALAEMEFYIVQEVRSYSLHVLLAMLSMWAFLRWCRGAGGRPGRWAALWVVSTTLLIYTHYLGAWTGVVQGLYALLFLRGRQRVAAVGLLLIPAALFAGWLLAVVLPYQTAKANADATIDASTLTTLLWYARSYLTQQWPLMLGLTLLGLVALRGGAVRVRPVNAAALLLLWIAVPVALTFIGNLRFSILTYYRISQITPPLVLLWALGLMAFQGRVRWFLIAVITVYGVFTVDFYRPKFPEPEFAALASQFARPGDVVLMDMKGVDFSLQYYLERQLPPGVTLLSLRQTLEWERERFETDLVPTLAAADTVWLPRWSDHPFGLELMGWFGHTQTAHRQMPYGHDSLLEAYRYDRLDPDAPPLAEWRNGMRLHRAAVYPDALRVDLWWGTGRELTEAFITSALLLDAGGALVAQYDSQPFLNERPTTQWQPGAVYYDPKPLATLSGGALPPGTYQVIAQVYRLTADGPRNVQTLDRQPWLKLGEITR